MLSIGPGARRKPLDQTDRMPANDGGHPFFGDTSLTSVSHAAPGSSGALVKLCDLDEVDEDEPAQVEIEGFRYAVFRIGDMVYVTADLCSHGPGYLSDGHVEDFQVVCPFHQGTFDIRTGAPTGAPCEHAIQTWTPVIADGQIFIDPACPN